MKAMTLLLATLSTSSLVSCSVLRDLDPNGGPRNYLTDKEHGLVADCQGRLLSTTHKRFSPAYEFWKENNLRKGTTRFVCKDGKAYSLKKATDCQGNLIYKMEGGLKGFENRHGLASQAGNISFTCNNGKVTVVPLSELMGR